MGKQDEHDSTGAPAWLLGVWRLRHCEPGVQILPGTSMEFRPEGVLIYRIPVEEEQHVFELEFSVEGNLLRTENAAAGHAQAVRFCRDAQGMLELDFAGKRAWLAQEQLM